MQLARGKGDKEMSNVIKAQNIMIEAQRYGKSSDGKVECKQAKPCKATSPGNKGNWKVSTIWYYEGKRISYKALYELLKGGECYMFKEIPEGCQQYKKKD